MYTFLFFLQDLEMWLMESIMTTSNYVRWNLKTISRYFFLNSCFKYFFVCQCVTFLSIFSLETEEGVYCISTRYGFSARHLNNFTIIFFTNLLYKKTGRLGAPALFSDFVYREREEKGELILRFNISILSISTIDIVWICSRFCFFLYKVATRTLP